MNTYTLGNSATREIERRAVAQFEAAKIAKRTGQKLAVNVMRPTGLKTNDSLPREAWIEVDKMISDVFRDSGALIGILSGLGLSSPISPGAMTSVYQVRSNMGRPHVSILPESNQDKDGATYGWYNVPSLWFKTDFDMNLQEEYIGDHYGIDLYGGEAQAAMEQNLLSANDLLVNGGFTDQPINGAVSESYGILTHPARLTQDLTDADINAANGTTPNGELVKEFVKKGFQKLVNKNFIKAGVTVIFGTPKNWAAGFKDDYTSEYPKSLESRLREFAGINDFAPDGMADQFRFVQIDQLPDNEAFFLVANRKVVEIKEAIGFQTVPVMSNYFNTDYCNVGKYSFQVKHLHDATVSDRTATTTGIVHFRKP